MKRSRFLALLLLLALLLSGCGGDSTPASPSDSEEPPPAPVLAEDDVTLPSIWSFANYKLEPEGDKDRDGYTTVFFDVKRDDAFVQEYVDLLTEHYHFSLRSNATYREGVDKYLDGAQVYYLDYTGTAPIVGFSNNTTSLGEVHDVDLVIVAKKTGFAIHFADGLAWVETDDRSTIFGGTEPQYPTYGGGGYEGDDDDDRRPRRCAVCGGDGEVDCSSCGGDGEDDCYSCRGHGTKDCSACGGSGER